MGPLTGCSSKTRPPSPFFPSWEAAETFPIPSSFHPTNDRKDPGQPNPPVNNKEGLKEGAQNLQERLKGRSHVPEPL